MRSFADYDEFSWDLLSGEAPATKSVTARVEVPGGAQQVACSSGPAGGSASCTGAQIRGKQAVFTEQNRASGDVTTIAVKLLSGQVANALPDLQPKASTSTRTDTAIPGVAALAIPLGTTAVAGAIGALVVRRKGRDLRFQGVPPGVIPPAHTHVPIALSDPIEIPVAFSPPRIPVAEAGLLIDGQVDVRETTATLVDLAVRGAIEMRQGSGEALMMRLVDPARVRAPHENVLLQSVFAGSPPGGWVMLSSRGSMDSAHRAMVTSVTNQVTSRGWFTDTPHTKALSGCGGMVGILFFIVPAAGASLMTLWPLIAAVIGAILVVSMVRSRLRRGQRTALGRAVTDQIEGFELYLTTAETEQLRFEEGEDIFSKYLPWAIIFDVADRWVNVCKPLVESGQLPAPTWSGATLGDLYLINSMLNSLNTVSMPAPAPSSGYSGTGFGGGSSFGGGGISSGGGGGGGSASSW